MISEVRLRRKLANLYQPFPAPAARYAESSSSPPKSLDSTSIQHIVTTYISTEYLDILTKYNYNVIFGPPEEERRAASKDGGFWRRVHNVTDYFAVRRHSESAIWVDRSRYISLSGAVQVFALSERSIEHLLRYKWEKDERIRSCARENVKAAIGPFKIRLLSNDNAILSVLIEEAEIANGIA